MREDWKEVNSGDILDIRDGTHDTPKYVDEKAYPLITSKNLKDGKITFTNIKYISEKDFIEISKRSKVDINDVLFAMIGTIGNPVLINKIPNFAIKNVGLFKNKINAIESKLLAYFLDSLTFKNQLEKRQLLKGTTQKFIPLGHLRNLHLPLPPLLEQKAIVAKIEQLFSELDKGIESLKTAQAKLKIYRQAVLKKAFEGELTKEWREQQTNLPTAKELLEAIKQEREAHYQQQLEEWKKSVQNVNKGKNEWGKISKPKEVTDIPKMNVDVKIQTYDLPDHWTWNKVGILCDVVRGGSPRPAGDQRFYNGNIPFLKVADITNTESIYLVNHTFTIKEAGLHKTRHVKSNTLLLSNSGATLGVPKILTFNATINDGIAAFIGLNPNRNLYLYYYFSSITKNLRQINQGAAQPNLNTDLIKIIDLPLCSLEEQNQIVQEIESRLSVCDKIEETIQNSLTKAEALRQSILKKAFEGKLLDAKELEAIKNHPEYESAEKLLQRIKLERAKK